MRMACLVAVMAAGVAWAGGFVGVPGSGVQYPDTIEADYGGKMVKMSLTGTAMRKKVILNVYTIGSYLEQGVKVKSAEELAAIDRPRRLHLVMERNIDGAALAEAFRSAVRLNHAEPAFNDEVNALVQFMKTTTVRKGEQILLTHCPGVGVHISVAGKADFLIRNVKFSRAIWDIYLGKNNLGDHIKTGLLSRI